jgi:site-specific DNA recombinase
VAIYIRWSTEDQGEGTTLAVQMEACRHYVASQGWQIRDDLIFIDDGHSGGSLDRPAMTRLRRRVKAGDVDCVVVFKIDRLSRSVIDTVTLVLKEWEDLTFLKSAREPVDTTSAMGKQFFYMLVSYAEWERNIIRERMFSGKLRRAKDGRSPGFPAAYGYRKGASPGTLTIDEAEAPVVRLVFDLADGGETVRGIARHLNDRGYQTRSGAPWGSSMVSKLLHNPVYSGQLVWGRTRINPRWRKGPGEPRVKQAEPYVALESASIPAIVSREQFERVQRRLAGNRQFQPGALGSEHLLTGLLTCRACGRTMQHNACRQWAYYRCARGGGHCQAPSVQAPMLEAAIVDALRARHEAQVAAAAAAELGGGRAAEQEALQERMAAVAGQLARLEAQERRMNLDYREGRLTAEERRELLAQVGAERERHERALGELQAELGAMEVAAAGQAGAVGIGGGGEAGDRADLFRPLPPDRQKQILRFLVKRIEAGIREPGVLEVNIVWAGAETE